MYNVWVGTDFHLWSAKLNAQHPFVSTSKLGRLSTNYATDIQVGDIFIYLGDLCDPEVTDIKKLRDFIQSIQGYKVLCKGNHDTQEDAFYLDIGFDDVCDVCQIGDLIFSHFPMKIAPTMINIHGHDHNKKRSNLGYQYINAYDEHHLEYPQLVEDLLKKNATYHNEDEVQTAINHVDYVAGEFRSVDQNTPAEKILDLTEKISLEEVAKSSIFAAMDIADLKKPEDLFKWMRQHVRAANHSKLKDEVHLIKSKAGSSHDQIYFAFPKLRIMEVSPKVMLVVGFDEDMDKYGFTHSFIYWTSESGKAFWFENYWPGQQDIHEFGSVEEMKQYIEDLYEQLPVAKRFDNLQFKNAPYARHKVGMTVDDIVEAIIFDSQSVNESIQSLSAVVAEPTEIEDEEENSVMDEIIFDDITLAKYFMADDDSINESKKKLDYVNDKGEKVPEVCPECGSEVKVFLRGEPVFCCSNKECDKYYGTVPCNINEDVSELSGYDREKQEEISKKYGIKAVGHDEPDSPQKRIDERREQRLKTLKKARRVKKRKAFVRKVKSKLPGKKNEDVDISDIPTNDGERQFFPSAISESTQLDAFDSGNLRGYQEKLLDGVDKLNKNNCESLLKSADRRADHLESHLYQEYKEFYESDEKTHKRGRYVIWKKAGLKPSDIKDYIYFLRNNYKRALQDRMKELNESVINVTYQFEMLDKVKFFDSINESAKDDETLYPVYVMLMHSGTALATAIKTVTQSNFSHSSISFDSSMTHMYSFGRKADINPFVGGFKRENIKDQFFQEREIPYALYVVPCTKSEIDLMKKRLDYFEKNRTKFRYDFTGLLKNYFGVADNPEYKWFCSRFVADILNAGRPSSDPYVIEPSLMKPEDFLYTNFAIYVTGGMLATYNKDQVDRLTKKIIFAERIRRRKEKALAQNESVEIYDLDPLNPLQEATLEYHFAMLDENSFEEFTQYLKSFKIRLDKDGNVIITRREYDQLDKHLRESVRMLKAYEKAGNVESVKDELCKIYYMVELINQYYLNPASRQNKTVKSNLRKEMMDLRSVMLNVFQQHLKWVTIRDPKFNFQNYYNTTKYSNRVEIPKSVVTSVGRFILTKLF